jgi:predicted Zn-dependent peptidase
VSGLSPDLEPLLEILADVVLRPRFAPAEAQRTRDEMLASLAQAVDEPTTLAHWNLARVLYGQHRFGKPMMGTPETVARLDAASARRFYESVFVPNGAIFFASGDVQMDDLLPRVGAAFGAWEPGDVPAPEPPPPSPAPPARCVVLVDRPDLVQAQILIGHEGIDRQDPRRIAAGLMDDVLGGGSFASRLIRALRTDAGLTYSAGSSFSLRRQPGPFTASTFTRVPEVRRTIDLALTVIGGMRSSPPSEAELRDARALLVGEFSLGLESSAAVLGALVDLEVHDLPQDSLDTYRRRVREATSGDAAQAALELLHPERAAIVVVGPADKIAPQLEGLGPVEVVKP